MLRTLRTRRPAFTLVEMLVVMGIMIALAGIAVAVAESGAFGSQKVISAADRASGWLLIAKQRAIRDQTANGVRFFRHPQAVQQAQSGQAVDPALAYRFTEAQYIEQPAPWVPTVPVGPGGTAVPVSLMAVRPLDTATTPPTPLPVELYLVAFDPRLPAGSQSPAAQQLLNEFVARVMPGTTLVVPQLGPALVLGDQNQSSPRQGLQIDYPAPGNTITIPNTFFRRVWLSPQYAQRTPSEPDLGAMNTPLANAATAPNIPVSMIIPGGGGSGGSGSAGFAFQEPPRPLIGEPVLQLTGNACIDFRDQTDVDLTKTLSNPYYLPTNLGQAKATDPRLTTLPPVSTTTSFGVEVNVPNGPPTPNGPPGSWEYFDILFTPTGQVQNAQGGLICLWVRDPDKLGPANNLQPHPRFQPPAPTDSPAAFDQAGEQVLVTVYTRSGYIAVHPVTRPGTGPDPYTAAKDGINSGF